VGLWSTGRWALWNHFRRRSRTLLITAFCGSPQHAARRCSDHGDTTADGGLIAERGNVCGGLLRGGSGALFANVGNDLVALFFADGCERVTQPDAGFFAEVNQDFAVEPEISGQGKNSNLQNTNPLGCLSLRTKAARTSTTEF